MHSFGKLLFGAVIAMLGGCVLAYDYDAHDTHGTGGSGGDNWGGSAGSGANGGVGGETSSSSSSSGMGGAGLMGVCNVAVCNESSSICDDSSCMDVSWAKRFGTDVPTRQEVRAVTIDKPGGIVIGGAYSGDPFLIGGIGLPMVGAPSGYIARLQADGTGHWAVQGQPGEVLAVATDSASNVIVGGTQVAGGSEYFYVEKRGATNPGMVLWNQLYGTQPNPARAVAVVTDALDNVYAVGTVSNSFTVECPPASGTTVSASVGMLIAKYNSAGDCQWLESYSTAAGAVIPVAMCLDANSNVWVTGTFQNTLADSKGNQLNSTVNGGNPDMFLIHHNQDTGVPEKPYAYGESPGGGGTIEPFDMEFDGQGNVAVAGMVTGQTVFAPTLEVGRTGAFIAKVGTSDGMPKAMVLPGGIGLMGEVARATSVAVASERMLVSGTFSSKIAIDPAQPDIVAPLPGAGITLSNTVFLAAIELSTFKLLSFEYFAGYGESFASRNVNVAAGQTFVVLSGGWSKTIDFSNGAGGQNMLQQDPSSVNADIFVAKFGYDP